MGRWVIISTERARRPSDFTRPRETRKGTECAFCRGHEHETPPEVLAFRTNGGPPNSNDCEFITVCPFAPRFPFETWVLPKTHGEGFEQMPRHAYRNMARALRDILGRLNKVLDSPPHNFLIHSLPIREPEDGYYHWHLEIMPELTKVAGFEWGTGFYINPTPPEDAARHLRDAWA